ncbi:MAG: DUF2934 domain-containing protein [Verrucomicrobiia bacterium]
MIHLTHEQIAKRAYEVYLRSGSLPGRDEENWLAAEIELKRDIEAAHAVTTPKPNGHSSIQPQVKVQAPPPLVTPVPPVVVKPTVSVTACGCTPPPVAKAKLNAPPAMQPRVKVQAPPPLVTPVPPVVVKPAVSATACGCAPPPAPKAKLVPRVRKAKSRQ